MSERRAGWVRAGFRRAGSSSSGSSGVTTWRGTQGLTPTVATAGAVVAGQNLVAQWAIGGCRVYAVDGTVGASGVGYSDSADMVAANVLAATVAAGAVAFKTIEEFLAVVPHDLAERTVLLVINQGTYTGDLTEWLSGVCNYNRITIRATGTVPTAGVTKFEGTANEIKVCGGVNATGMNAAGYNPTAVTTTQATLQKVGGAAPAFPAEPAIPAGLRFRFDSASTTPGVRNLLFECQKVSGGNVIGVAAVSATLATAVVADVLYIEQPGVIVPPLTITSPKLSSVAINIAGLAFNGQLSVYAGTVQFAFCTCIVLGHAENAAITSSNIVNGPGLPLTNTYSISAGSGLRNVGIMTPLGRGAPQIGFSRGLFTGAVEWLNPSGSLQCQQVVFAGGVAIQGSNQATQSSDPADAFGSPTAVPCRIIGPNVSGGLWLRGGKLRLSTLDITNMGALPAIRPDGTCDLYFGSVVSGATGNTGVGLDLTNSRGSRIVLATTPTVTGGAGDVKLADGTTIITWAQAAKGIVDSAGNHIFAASRGPNRKIPFSGSIVGAAGAAVSYLADSGPLAANQVVPLRRPVSSVLMRALRVTNLANTSANQTTVTLYKNGVATTMTVAIPAGTAANTKFADTAHLIYFDDADDYDLRMDDGALDAGGIVTVSGTLEYC